MFSCLFDLRFDKIPTAAGVRASMRGDIQMTVSTLVGVSDPARDTLPHDWLCRRQFVVSVAMTTHGWIRACIKIII